MAQTKRLDSRNEKGDGDRSRGRFKCTTCDKTFKRSEHCARHELMHTQERPFVCRYCSKRYGRKDLLRRHERTIHAVEYESNSNQDHLRQSPVSNSTGELEADGDDIHGRHKFTAPGNEMPSAARGSEGNGLGKKSQLPALGGGVVTEISQGQSYGDASRMASPLFLHLGGLDTPPGSNNLLLSLLRDSTPQLVADSLVIDRPSTEPQDPANVLQSCEAIFPGHEPYRESSRRGTPGSVTDLNLIRQDLESNHSTLPIWSDANAGGVLENFNLGALDMQMDLGNTPVDAWSKNPENLTLHLPIILQQQPATSPKNIIDETSFEWLHTDASMRLGVSGPESKLFTLKELQQFINSYIDSFHQHLPLIHIHSLSAVNTLNTPCPLTLAMASIGALYRLKRRRAHELYALTEKMISSSAYQISNGPSRTPLWLLQAKILLAFFAILSNKESLASTMFNKMGFMMLEYQWRRIELQHQASDRNMMTWKQWVNHEETKRALCAMFIFSDLMLITFNITPGFVIDRDLLIEMPDHEDLWAAKSEEDWSALRETRPDTPQHTMQSILECMIQPPTSESLGVEPYRMSGFTALVVMHGVNIYLWHLNQLAQSVSRFSLGIWPHENLRATLLHAATLTLERCEAALQADRPKDYKLAWDDPEHILIFNCEAVLRAAHSRLLPPMHTFNRLALLTDDRDVITRAVKSYASKRLERTHFVTKAARKAYEGFLVPVTIGPLLVSKTAALSWSVEQAVAGWDSALLLTKWIHSLEMDSAEHPPDPDELQLVGDVKNLLGELEFEIDENSQQKSLAAILAEGWASFLDDVWVWGITPRMGSILRLLAVEYQDQLELVQARWN